MNFKLVNVIGIVFGAAWLVTVIIVGLKFFNFLAARFGDTFGALSLFYVLGWLLVLFIGRAVLERILIAILSVAEATFGARKIAVEGVTSATSSPMQTPVGWVMPVGAAAALTIAGTNLTVPISTKGNFIDPEIYTSTSSES